MAQCNVHGATIDYNCKTCTITTSVSRKSIQFAGQHEVRVFETEMAQILEALGHPEALVTDASLVIDFPVILPEEMPLDGPEWDAVTLADLSQDLGVPVYKTDRLVDVAARMRANR